MLLPLVKGRWLRPSTASVGDGGFGESNSGLQPTPACRDHPLLRKEGTPRLTALEDLDTSSPPSSRGGVPKGRRGVGSLPRPNTASVGVTRASGVSRRGGGIEQVELPFLPTLTGVRSGFIPLFPRRGERFGDETSLTARGFNSPTLAAGTEGREDEFLLRISILIS